jgi:hypothetical protein
MAEDYSQEGSSELAYPIGQKNSDFSAVFGLTKIVD